MDDNIKLGCNWLDADVIVHAALAKLPNKVDKEAGKGLSSTDFTQAEKDKLGAIPAVVYGSGSFSGDGIATAFTIAHSLGAVPTQVLVSPTSAVAGAAHHVSAKTSTNFTITYAAAPATGTNNGTLDFLVK